jgi:hypothetical protein
MQHDIAGFPTATLELLKEYRLTQLSLDTFFNDLCESYTIFGAELVYLPFDDTDNLQSLQNYLSSNSQTRLSYMDIPYKSNVFTSIAGLKDQLKRSLLKLPGNCEVRSEALKIQKATLEKPGWEKNYPLLPSLASVISGFLKDPPSPPLRIPGVDFNMPTGPAGWMAT